MKNDLSEYGYACNCVKCNTNKGVALPKHPVDSLFTMYRKCRAAIVKSMQEDGLRNSAIAQYMFKERPVTPTTWIELQEMPLDTYILSDGTALPTDLVTREYCYVFWDEAGQASNPYSTHAEAVAALSAYIP